MKGLGALAVAALGGWAFLAPGAGSWAFAAAEFAFLAWLARELRGTNLTALLARAHEPLACDEADIVQRYALYFERPVYALRLATAKGDRDALRLLSAHDGAMRQLSAPDKPGA